MISKQNGSVGNIQIIETLQSLFQMTFRVYTGTTDMVCILELLIFRF